MKAAYIEETGPPENIRYGELPVPIPRGSQVLVRVGAVSVNPIDVYIRGGAVPAELPRPYIVGCDVAGTVEGLGPEVRRLKPGDRVWGSNQGLLGRQGTFAELVAVEEQWLYPTPAKVSDEEAAAIALVGLTSHLGLFREARLQPGELVLVNSGSGGVGSTVVQMAKAHGARVIATAGGEEKAAYCRECGADLALSYQAPDLEEKIRAFAPGGVNLWWETSREPNLERIIGLLADRGRVILMAGREARPPFPVGPFYVKGCSIHGFAMFKATAEEQARAAEAINRWLSEKKLKPRIARRMRLGEAGAAHRMQEASTLHHEGNLMGKLVLNP